VRDDLGVGRPIALRKKVEAFNDLLIGEGNERGERVHETFYHVLFFGL
jgi:hypothetical protein